MVRNAKRKHVVEIGNDWEAGRVSIGFGSQFGGQFGFGIISEAVQKLGIDSSVRTVRKARVLGGVWTKMVDGFGKGRIFDRGSG